MATHIRTWEIVKGELRPVETTLADHGRTEHYDLEAWIATDPSILRPGLKIIGRQVMTRSGPLDLLAIDRSGDLYVIELKRDRLPREALAQAIDYASDIQSWPVERVSEICAQYTKRTLDDVFNEAFPDTDLESVTINESQRILLVGFALDPSLERMIEWLSEQYGLGINAVILKYVRTSSGTELLTKTSILSEEMEDDRARKKKFTIPTSDDPGHYPLEELKRLLKLYLRQTNVTARRMRDVLFPCVSRVRSLRAKSSNRSLSLVRWSKTRPRRAMRYRLFPFKSVCSRTTSFGRSSAMSFRTIVGRRTITG
jgi:hypothetical protein